MQFNKILCVLTLLAVLFAGCVENPLDSFTGDTNSTGDADSGTGMGDTGTDSGSTDSSDFKVTSMPEGKFVYEFSSKGTTGETTQAELTSEQTFYVLKDQKEILTITQNFETQTGLFSEKGNTFERMLVVGENIVTENCTTMMLNNFGFFPKALEGSASILKDAKKFKCSMEYASVDNPFFSILNNSDLQNLEIPEGFVPENSTKITVSGLACDCYKNEGIPFMPKEQCVSTEYPSLFCRVVFEDAFGGIIGVKADSIQEIKEFSFGEPYVDYKKIRNEIIELDPIAPCAKDCTEDAEMKKTEGMILDFDKKEMRISLAFVENQVGAYTVKLFMVSGNPITTLNLKEIEIGAFKTENQEFDKEIFRVPVSESTIEEIKSFVLKPGEAFDAEPAIIVQLCKGDFCVVNQSDFTENALYYKINNKEPFSDLKDLKEELV